MKPKAIAVIVLACCASIAVAEDTSRVAQIPSLSCEKPGDPPLQPTYEQQKRYDKKRDGYKECVMKYVGDMKQQADAQFEAGKKYQDAANGAIDEYNNWANQANTTLKKDK
jgi:hypothetical protein